MFDIPEICTDLYLEVALCEAEERSDPPAGHCARCVTPLHDTALAPERYQDTAPIQGIQAHSARTTKFSEHEESCVCDTGGVEGVQEKTGRGV